MATKFVDFDQKFNPSIHFIEVAERSRANVVLGKGNCQAIFAGLSGSIDTAGMIIMFQRTVEKHGLQYTEFDSEGDSKAHNLLVQKAVYGDTQVKKLERVGHGKKCLC